MKLICQCGHPNVLHFAGTGHCHKNLEIESPENWPDLTGEPLERMLHPKCSCTRFVAQSPLDDRADLS